MGILGERLPLPRPSKISTRSSFGFFNSKCTGLNRTRPKLNHLLVINAPNLRFAMLSNPMASFSASSIILLSIPTLAFAFGVTSSVSLLDGRDLGLAEVGVEMEGGRLLRDLRLPMNPEDGMLRRPVAGSMTLRLRSP